MVEQERRLRGSHHLCLRGHLANQRRQDFDRVRVEAHVRTARAIYRDSVLSRYASDPVDPIRIVVDNGHVTLYGSVENTMDKTLAGMRANSVPGAFSAAAKYEACVSMSLRSQ